MKIDQKDLENVIRTVISSVATSGTVKCLDEKSKIMSIDGSKVEMESFDTGNPSDRVWLKDVITSENNKNLAAGFMKMINTEFAWTLNYDEIDYIIEGQLIVKINGKEIVADAGDVLMIPAGSSIIWSAKDYAKFVYVTYPANWEEQIK